MTDADLKKVAQTQRQQGDLEGAASTLEQAINRTGAELADLYGILGGTRREQGDIVSAAAAYDEGFKIDTRFGIASTYNEFNRLITRVMLMPLSLSDPEVLRDEQRVEFVDVRQALSQLQNRLERQIATDRSDDFWASGDLAITAALNGDLEAATLAVRRFASLSPPRYALSAYRMTISSLVKLDLGSRVYLEEVDALLSTGV